MPENAPKPKEKPLAIDLFCGAGGLTAGLKIAGFRVSAAVDSDELAIETYRDNHEEVHAVCADIRDVDAAKLLCAAGVAPGELDVVAGCPPCQGFSTMRTRNGGAEVSEPQNDLIFEWLRFVRECRPRAVMLENVPGLATDARIRKVRTELRGLGYGIADRVLNVRDYGVPQRRRRFILLGLGANRGKPNFGTPAPERLTVRDAIAGLGAAGSSGDALHDIPERRSQRIKDLIAEIPQDGGSRSDLPEEKQLRCHRESDGWKDVYGRMAWSKPAPTITGGCVNPSRGRFLHPTENRAITLREAALLQSFDAAYKFSLSRGKFAAAQMIGNALPPAFVACHAEALKAGLERPHAGPPDG